MSKFYRHGDLALVSIEKLPAGLKPARTNVLMEGSHGNPHKVQNGTVYLKKVDEFVFGYLVAKKGCTLIHVDHGDGKRGMEKTAHLPEGIYELRRQVEKTHQGMKPVID